MVVTAAAEIAGKLVDVIVYKKKAEFLTQPFLFFTIEFSGYWSFAGS